MAADNPHHPDGGMTHSYLDDYKPIESGGPEGASANNTDRATAKLLNQLRGVRKNLDGHVDKQEQAEAYARSEEQLKTDENWRDERYRKLLGRYFDPSPAEKRGCYDQATREMNSMRAERMDQRNRERREAEVRAVRANDSAAGQLRRILEGVFQRQEIITADRLGWQNHSRAVHAMHGIDVPTLEEMLEQRKQHDNPWLNVFVDKEEE